MSFENLGIVFFRVVVWGPFSKKVNIFTYTCPNRSGVGAIDSPDQFEHVFDPNYTWEVLEKNFTHDILMVRLQKFAFFGGFKVFMSNFLYFSLYQRKLKVIARAQCVLPFFLYRLCKELSQSHCGRVITLTFLR